MISAWLCRFNMVNSRVSGVVTSVLLYVKETTSYANTPEMISVIICQFCKKPSRHLKRNYVLNDNIMLCQEKWAPPSTFLPHVVGGNSF